MILSGKKKPSKTYQQGDQMAIFWVDDDIKSFTRPYHEELKEEGYEIQSFIEPDSALEYFKNHHHEFSCAIIDLMLPTGKTFTAEETELGTRTGKFLIEELRKIDKNNLPMIILSIVGDREIIDWAIKNKIKYLKKSKTFPRELLKTVKELEKKPQAIGTTKN